MQPMKTGGTRPLDTLPDTRKALGVSPGAGGFPEPALAFVWPEPSYRPVPPPKLSRRRVAGWLTGTAAAGAALVLAGPVAELTAPHVTPDSSLHELLHLFGQMDEKQQTTLLAYAEDLLAGWNDTGWTRMNLAPEGGLTAVANDFCGLEEAFNRRPYPGAKHGTPEDLKNEEHTYEICEMQDVLMERVATYHAKTPNGVRQKARILAAFFSNDYPENVTMAGRLLRSTIEDAAGVTGGVL